MTEEKKVEEKVKTLNVEDFIKEYELLCKKYNMRIAVVPAFKSMADTGTFSVVLQTGIEKLPA